MNNQDKLVEMQVKGLMIDPMSNVPIVILRSDDTSQFLPIWIGVFEANAIALQLEGVEVPRPMTHDLMNGLLELLDTKVTKVIVSDLEEGTFFAEIHMVDSSGEEKKIDSRPSDAIALGLRMDAPILVAEIVLEKAKTDESTERLNSEEKLKKWLEELDPEDLGKYTM